MHKKLVLTLLFSVILSTLTAQEKKTPQLLKYVTTAPDGSASLTIYDNTGSNIIRLEAAQNFYKYQLLDINTNKQVYSEGNRGNKCTINKLKIADGTYSLKLYTKNFIISSRVTIAAVERNSVAIND